MAKPAIWWLSAPAEVTPALLQGVDLLLLPGWSAYTVGTPGGGQQQVYDNLTAAEMDAISAWVESGGSLLVIARPMGRAEEVNLPELLLRFGTPLDFRSRQHRPHTLAEGNVGGRTYRVALPEGWSWPVAGGEPLLSLDGQTLGVVAPYGRGKVALLGNGQFFSMGISPALDRPGLGAFDQEDNAVFMLELLNFLTGSPALSSNERQHLAWEARLLTTAAAMAYDDSMNGRPRSPERSDFAVAQGLLAAAAEGRRCDLGPGWVPFSIDELARAELVRAAGLTDQALAALDEAESAWARRDYAAVDLSHAQALARGREAVVAVKGVRARYDAISGAYYSILPLEPGVVLPILGTCLAAGAGFWTWRRRATQ
ncbi:MAG: hypothetical protein ACYC4L_06855 [Chloroflexota bacterium]